MLHWSARRASEGNPRWRVGANRWTFLAGVIPPSRGSRPRCDVIEAQVGSRLSTELHTVGKVFLRRGEGYILSVPRERHVSLDPELLVHGLDAGNVDPPAEPFQGGGGPKRLRRPAAG